MKAYSTDLRERVLAALDSGMPRGEVIRLFQVSQGSITRWLRLRRSTGTLTPSRPSGRPRTMPPQQEQLLRLQLEVAPDAALATHAAQWNDDHRTSLSSWTIVRAIRRLGWSRKKDPNRQRTRSVGTHAVCA